jgi:hypothetical protein
MAILDRARLKRGTVPGDHVARTLDRADEIILR